MTSFLLPTCLVLHITGITMMAGTALIDTIFYKQFFRQYNIDQTKAAGTLEASGKIAVLFPIGFLLLLLSGVSIMLLTHGIYAEQTWFKIKMILVIITVVNGLAVGRRTGLQVRKNVAVNNTAAVINLKQRLLVFHITQLTLFAAIFVMGVFKFN